MTHQDSVGTQPSKICLGDRLTGERQCPVTAQPLRAGSHATPTPHPRLGTPPYSPDSLPNAARGMVGGGTNRSTVMTIGPARSTERERAHLSVTLVTELAGPLSYFSNQADHQIRPRLAHVSVTLVTELTGPLSYFSNQADTRFTLEPRGT